ncbi:XdhC family protein [Altererythrobacter sp. CAU 1778]
MNESTDWLVTGLEDDVRPRMFEAAGRAEPFALATIVKADGGPRPIGAQMVVTAAGSWGFLSGGCIEDDVALRSREVLVDGKPRRVIYGTGSPMIDMRLPCGGSIEVAIEQVMPDDPALAELQKLTEARRPARWTSDGRSRQCLPNDAPAPPATITCLYEPRQRLIVVGSDPFALAMAGLGQTIGWETMLLTPFGPESAPPSGGGYDRRSLDDSFADLRADRWTAIAVATHDLEKDHEALVPALQSEAGFVGVLGSRRKLDTRREGLRAAGLREEQIARLSAPIGLDIGASSPWEVALSVIAEIVAARQGRASAANRMQQGPHVAA